MKRTELTRKTPLQAKRAGKPRRVAATCTIRGCKRRPVAEDVCASHAKLECDRLFSLIVRAPGVCVSCGATTNLQAAHIVSRRYSGTRYDPANCVALCAREHTFWTHRPLEWDQWCYDRLGYDYDLLRQKALAGGRLDWAEILPRLRAEASTLGLLTASPAKPSIAP